MVSEKQNNVKVDIDVVLQNINTRLDSIDQKLNNHIAHMAADISTINANVDWLKKFRMSDAIRPHEDPESKDDIKTQQDVDWLKRFFWVGMSAVITSLASIGITLIHIFFQNLP